MVAPALSVLADGEDLGIAKDEKTAGEDFGMPY
jgi:hypothetical protein